MTRQAPLMLAVRSGQCGNKLRQSELSEAAFVRALACAHLCCAPSAATACPGLHCCTSAAPPQLNATVLPGGICQQHVASWPQIWAPGCTQISSLVTAVAALRYDCHCADGGREAKFGPLNSRHPVWPPGVCSAAAAVALSCTLNLTLCALHRCSRAAATRR